MIPVSRGVGVTFLNPLAARDLHAKGDAVFLDARARTDYAFRHIAGAVHVDWRAFCDPEGGRTARLHPSLDIIEGRLAEMGVMPERNVVLYDDPDQSGGADGRLAWMLWYLGHDRVMILDGGWSAWRGVRGPVDVDPVRQTGGGGWRVRPRDRALADVDEVESGLRSQTIRLIDSHSPDRPVIRSTNPVLHVDWFRFRQPDGTRRLPHEVCQLLASYEVGMNDRIITVCSTGLYSAWVWSVLMSVGYSDVGYYVGPRRAWSEVSSGS